MAKMVYAGEDPRFIYRRMIIFASEDVGMADPNALQHTIAASRAFDYVGMPEGRFHLAQAALYLSTAPKSNSTFAFFDALDAVQKEREAEVPNHLRDSSRDKEGFGHGEATSTRTPTATIGWPSSTCRTPCRGRASTSRPSKVLSTASVTTWPAAGRRNWLRCWMIRAFTLRLRYSPTAPATAPGSAGCSAPSARRVSDWQGSASASSNWPASNGITSCST